MHDSCIGKPQSEEAEPESDTYDEQPEMWYSRWHYAKQCVFVFSTND